LEVMSFEPADRPGVVTSHSPLLKQERAPHFLDSVAPDWHQIAT
jgi:hypothetical protein